MVEFVVLLILHFNQFKLQKTLLHLIQLIPRLLQTILLFDHLKIQFPIRHHRFLHLPKVSFLITLLHYLILHIHPPLLQHFHCLLLFINQLTQDLRVRFIYCSDTHIHQKLQNLSIVMLIASFFSIF